MLTALTAFLAFVVILIILVPVRPSRENVISMPSLRRNVCARRSRPASAREFFAHAGPRAMSLRVHSAHNRNRSDALPLHMVRSVMIARTQVAMGSVSMMLSMAARRLDRRDLMPAKRLAHDVQPARHRGIAEAAICLTRERGSDGGQEGLLRIRELSLSFR